MVQLGPVKEGKTKRNGIARKRGVKRGGGLGRMGGSCSNRNQGRQKEEAWRRGVKANHSVRRRADGKGVNNTGVNQKGALFVCPGQAYVGERREEPEILPALLGGGGMCWKRRTPSVRPEGEFVVNSTGGARG